MGAGQHGTAGFKDTVGDFLESDSASQSSFEPLPQRGGYIAGGFLRRGRAPGERARRAGYEVQFDARQPLHRFRDLLLTPRVDATSPDKYVAPLRVYRDFQGLVHIRANFVERGQHVQRVLGTCWRLRGTCSRDYGLVLRRRWGREF